MNLPAAEAATGGGLGQEAPAAAEYASKFCGKSRESHNFGGIIF